MTRDEAAARMADEIVMKLVQELVQRGSTSGKSPHQCVAEWREEAEAHRALGSVVLTAAYHTAAVMVGGLLEQGKVLTVQMSDMDPGPASQAN